ncbi:MAG: tRNA uridine-5-carboxymethylaminomethyl(34) synthesis GTPase MnmE [Bacteroidales bacterium]|nr:tRNA uridine-5-carboxymethylaminomethyl(34) synthesis GTPase MnmE [Bacteroidales bacterium]
MNNNDIICAPATVPGTGAISVIRVSGKGSLELADKVISLRKGSIAQSKGYTLHFGSIFASDGSLLDEVIVSVFRAPNSYTGEDGVEISCHSSKYIVSETIGLLCEKGCRMAGPGEFTQRAYLNGKMDLAQAEAVADVIAADSKAALRVAQSQLRGEYSAAFKELRDALVRLSALVELELDFSEEEVEFASREMIIGLAESAIAKMSRLRDSYRVGNALKNGVPVAIVGAPNVGKSTLLNALLGEDRAITSDIPGTTRDTVEESIVIEGVRYRFIDTAGIRETEQMIERLGIERSLAKIRDAAIVICLLDATKKDESEQMLSKVESLIDSENQKIIVVANKSDLNGHVKEELSGLSEGAISISALRKEGLRELEKAIVKCGFADTDEHVIVTSARHYNALSSAVESLRAVVRAVREGISEELLAEDLRAAICDINSIFASTSDSITPDEVLGEVFGKFCVGK